MSLRPLVPVLAIALLAGAGTAAADNLNGGKLKLKLKLHPEAGGSSFIDPDTTYLAKFFNEARCACDVGGTPQEYRIEYSWATQPTTTPSHVIDVWTGQTCDNEMQRDTTCVRQDPITDLVALDHTVQREYRVRDLIVARDATSCPNDRTYTVEHWAVTQDGNTWDPDNRDHVETTPPNTTMPTAGITMDLHAPTVPTTLTADALEGGIRLTWDPLTAGDQSDIFVYQALCARAPRRPPPPPPTPTPP
jgi:hypothetical protein